MPAKSIERRHDTFGRFVVAYAQRVHRQGDTRTAAEILRIVGHSLEATRRLLLGANA